MEFRVLGPVETWSDGQSLRLGGPRPRALLAILLLAEGRTVAVDRLISALWERPPATAVAQVQAMVSALRRVLSAQRIDTRNGGYRIRADAAEVDWYRFQQLVAQAGEAAPRERSRLLAEAVGLWRGPALVGLPATAILAAEARRLGEQQLKAVEDRIGADLDLGRHADLVGELTSLVAEHPLREGLRGQLMLTLYRCGRQAEALECYRSGRDVLQTELGLEPGQEIQRLHIRILTAAADLQLGPQPDGEVPDGEVPDDEVPDDEGAIGDDLPPDLTDFTGRGAEIHRLVDVAGRGDTALVVAVVHGMPGVGKTALAVHVAHALAPRYPDGRIYLNLHGHSSAREPVPADEALGRLLTAIGVPGDRIPADLDDRAAKWRRELAGRRVLVLLDNAASAGQVRPLLPGAGGCLVLVTSRGALPDLDATAVLSLPVLSAADALDLFSRVVGDARTAGETSATGHVVELCGRLPLAVRIAASRLRDRTWTVSRLADRLRAESRRLSELSGGDRSVAGAFALSYANLPADRRRTFRLASLQPADEISGHAAAALTGTPYPELERMLDDLVAAHLVDEPTAGRYRLHDLLRDYGRERAATDDSSDQRRAAVHRMLDYYLHVAADANSRLADEYDPLPLDIQHPPEATPALPDHAAAMAWFETERHTLLSVVRYAVAEGWDGHAWQLANELWRFYYFRGYLDDWLVVGRLAVGAAVRTGADIGLAASYNNLAAIHWRRAEIDQAIEAMRQTLEIRRRTGHRLGEAKALNNLGILYVERGAFAAALVPYREALDIYRDLGLEHKAALLLGNRATALRYLGRYEEALAEQLASLDAMRSAALAHNVAVALLKLGDAYLPLGRHDEALAAYAEALTLVRDLGDRYFEGFVLNGLGNLHRETGRYPQAVSYQQQALDRMRDLADREAEARILNDFALLYRRMGESAVAHDTYRAAVAVARTAGTRYEQARALAGMARSWTAVASVAGSDEEPRTAEDCRRAATELFAAQGVPEPALDRAGGDRHPAGTQ